jgi:hypothetical protein
MQDLGESKHFYDENKYCSLYKAPHFNMLAHKHKQQLELLSRWGQLKSVL